MTHDPMTHDAGQGKPRADARFAMKIFEYENGGEFRVFDRNGEPWFVHTDVCRELEVGNPRQAASRLDEDEKGVITVDTLGGPQKTIIINESGLYNLILTSRKPEAKKFKKWITAEVLPSIRRTGSYGTISHIPSFIRRYTPTLRESGETSCQPAPGRLWSPHDPPPIP